MTAIQRSVLTCFLIILAPLFTWGQTQSGGGVAAAQGLFQQRFESHEAFEAAAQKARDAGAPEQVLLEAEILFAVFSGGVSDVDRVGASLGQGKKAWDFASAQLIRSGDDFEAFQALLMARKAVLENNQADLKKYVGEAFWAQPSLASILENWVSKFKTDQKMADLTLDLSMVLFTSEDGAEQSLGDLLEGKKAVLFDFWASWCQPCIQSMPSLIEKSKKLHPQGVVVAGVNLEGQSQAESMRKRQGINFPWLYESETKPLASALEINPIPWMALISPEGEILFHGHPSDVALKTALADLGVTL